MEEKQRFENSGLKRNYIKWESSVNSDRHKFMQEAR